MVTSAWEGLMMTAVPVSRPSVVALFNACDDTVEMVRCMLSVGGYTCVVGCQLADVKTGTLDVAAFLTRHQPDVRLFDISPPCQENWRCFESLRRGDLLGGRGVVLTPPHKARLDETVGPGLHGARNRRETLRPDANPGRHSGRADARAGAERWRVTRPPGVGGPRR